MTWAESIGKWAFLVVEHVWLKGQEPWLWSVGGFMYRKYFHILSDETHRSKVVTTFRTFIEPIKNAMALLCSSSCRKSSARELRLETQEYMWKHGIQQVVCKSFSSITRQISTEISNIQSKSIVQIKVVLVWQVEQALKEDPYKCLKAMIKRGQWGGGVIWWPPRLLYNDLEYGKCVQVRKSH